MFSVSISNQAIYIGAETVPLRGMDNVMTTSDASRECCCNSSCSRRWRFVCEWERSRHQSLPDQESELTLSLRAIISASVILSEKRASLPPVRPSP